MRNLVFRDVSDKSSSANEYRNGSSQRSGKSSVSPEVFDLSDHNNFFVEKNQFELF